MEVLKVPDILKEHVLLELISTDNPDSYGSQYIGRIGEAYCSSSQLFFSFFFQTSQLKNINIVDDIINVQTRNTLYTFKVIK